jgi:hypothetical protein
VLEQISVPPSCIEAWEVSSRRELILLKGLDLGHSCLSTGKAEGDGKMHITLCDFIVPWDTLSPTQKKSLNHRYQMGCECKVSRPAPTGALPLPGSRGGEPVLRSFIS